MMKGKFKAGVHPYEGKEYSGDKEIKRLNSEEIMVFPMSQHIGAPATPCVKVGDRVLKGMKIGQASSFVSSPVYSSVSGKVKAIEDRLMLSGKVSKCVIVTNDFENDSVENFGINRDVNTLSNEEIIKIIGDSGIVGMGGAGFPTGVKLSPKNQNIDYIIINGSECEPYLTSDYRLMLERSRNIIEGIAIVLRLFEKAKAIIGIEDNKPKAIDALSFECNGNSRINVMPLSTRYPQGGERRLISSVTGRQINSHILPADAGVIVLNIATVIAIYEAVKMNMPLIHRVVTLTGDAMAQPANVDVLLGVSHKFLCDECGGLKDNAVKIISGGPMMGMAMDSLDYPVVKTSSSILAISKDDVEKMETTSCIRCGRCVGVCPETLVPQLMAQAAVNKDYERFEKLYGMECIECGCCTYVCPAKRPLTQTFKLAKIKVRESKIAK